MQPTLCAKLCFGLNQATLSGQGRTEGGRAMRRPRPRAKAGVAVTFLMFAALHAEVAAQGSDAKVLTPFQNLRYVASDKQNPSTLNPKP